MRSGTRRACQGLRFPSRTPLRFVNMFCLRSLLLWHHWHQWQALLYICICILGSCALDMCGYASSPSAGRSHMPVLCHFAPSFLSLHLLILVSEFCNGLALVGHCGHDHLHMHIRPLWALAAVPSSPFNGVHGTRLPDMSPRHAIFAVFGKEIQEPEGTKRGEILGRWTTDDRRWRIGCVW